MKKRIYGRNKTAPLGKHQNNYRNELQIPGNIRNAYHQAERKKEIVKDQKNKKN